MPLKIPVKLREADLNFSRKNPGLIRKSKFPFPFPDLHTIFLNPSLRFLNFWPGPNPRA